MKKSYISSKTGKPYYGATAQNHFIYTIEGGIEKYNSNIGKDYLLDTLCVITFCIYFAKPLVNVTKILIAKHAKSKKK